MTASASLWLLVTIMGTRNWRAGTLGQAIAVHAERIDAQRLMIDTGLHSLVCRPLGQWSFVQSRGSAVGMLVFNIRRAMFLWSELGGLKLRLQWLALELRPRKRSLLLQPPLRNSLCCPLTHSSKTGPNPHQYLTGNARRPPAIPIVWDRQGHQCRYNALSRYFHTTSGDAANCDTA